MADKKKTNTYIIGAIAVILIIVIVAGVLVLTKGNNNANAQTTTIVANVNKDCAGTPWFVGVEKGFFNNSGTNFVDAGHLDWSLQPAALASGQTNVYSGHPNTIINLIKAGAGVKGVLLDGTEPVNGNAPENLGKDHMHFLVLENSTLRTPADIPTFVQANNRKVKIAVGATGICADLELNAWLRKNNIPKDDVDLVILSDPLQEAALRQGTVDVITLHPPFFTAAEKHGGVRIYFTSTDAFGTNAGTSLLVFTEDFIKNNPDTVRKFSKAFREALIWANDHRDEAGAITARNIGLDASTVHWYSYSGVITDEKIQPWIDAMVADGLLQPGEIKASDLYTTEFSDVWDTSVTDT
jgi:ABC-type nitrate/sulfonate/bicarbonate transport systems, periplasmic components